jgi:hypothetical protein
MEMEEASEDDTAGAQATPRTQVAKQQVPVTDEEKEQILVGQWLVKMELEFKSDKARCKDINERRRKHLKDPEDSEDQEDTEDPPTHQISSEDFWYKGGVEHNRWRKGVPEFIQFVLQNLPQYVLINDGTNGKQMRVRAENLIDTSHGNFCPESYTNWRIVASVNRKMADGTREKVQIAVAPRHITALERRGYTVWQKPRKNLDADEQNWTDLKTELLETQSKEKGRAVSIKEFLSWNYVFGPTSDVDVAAQETQPPLAAQETQPPRPTTAGKNIPMPTVPRGAVRAKPRTAKDNVPPPRPSTGGKGALRPTIGVQRGFLGMDT